MNLLARAKAAVGRMLIGDVEHPRQSSWARFLLPNTTIDFAKHVGDGLGSNVFMSPIMWIWRASLEARIAVITEEKDKEDMDLQHELAQLLARPNPFLTGAALRLAIFISWFTDGNCYLLKARDGSGKVRQLWYVPHWMIEPKWNESVKGAFIDYYCYTPGGVERLEVLPSEIVHLRNGVDPRDVRKGFSYMKMLLREIFNDDESSNFVAALLLNGGVPGIIISPKESTGASTDDLKATKDYISTQFGRSNKGKALAIGEPTEVKEFGYDPQKMNLGIVRNVSEERVCAGLGLPAAVVGFGSGMEQTAVGATLQELHRIAWIDCLIPNQDLLADEFTRNFREDFSLKDNQRLGWDRRRVRALMDDLNKESERLDRGVRGGWIMVSEARKSQGLEVKPEDEIYLRGIGMIPEGPGAPDLPEPAAAPVPGAAAGEPEIDPLTGKPKVKAARRRLSKQQTALIRAMDKVKARTAKRFESRLNEFFKNVGAAAAEAFLATKSKAAGNVELKTSDEIAVELMFGSMNMQKHRQELRGIFGAHFVLVHKESVQILAGMGLGANLSDSVEVNILAKGGTRAGLVDMTTQARAKALKIIAEGREEGRNPIDIAKDLAEAVPAGRFNDPRTRAELIARTETREAQTESALLTYRATPGIDQVMIIDGRLGETDDDCEEANGQIVDFDTARGLLAAEHPNGTRDLVPMFGGA